MYMVVLAAIGPLLFMQAGNPIVQPPAAPANITNVTNVQVMAPPPDPEVVAESTQQSFQAVFVNMVSPTLIDFTNKLLDLPDLWRTTPPDLTYNHPGVRSLAELIRNVAYGLIALMVLAWGIAKALGQDPFIGRPFLGIVLAVGNLAWWQIGIDLNNAINTAIGAPDLPGIIRPHLQMPAVGANPAAAFGPVVLVVVYAFVALLLLFSLVFRLGLIDILIAVGSLALICKGSEQSEGFYEKYIGLSIGTLFSQVLVVVCLRLAPILGGIGTGVAGTLLGLVVLLLARKAPSLVAPNRMQGGSGIGRVGLFMLLRRAFR